MTDLDLAALKAAARCGDMTDPFSVLALIERLERAELDLRLCSASLSAVKEALRQTDAARDAMCARLEKLDAVAKAARDYKDNFYDDVAGRLFALLEQALAALEAAP